MTKSVRIYLDVTILSLRNISTVLQTFESVFIIQFEWSDTLASGTWVPKPFFLNSVGPIITIDRSVKNDRTYSNGPMLTHTCRLIMSGTFSETFELMQFPMDVQQFTISAVLVNCPIVTPLVTHGERYKLVCRNSCMVPAGLVDVNSWSLIAPLFSVAVTEGAAIDVVSSEGDLLNKFNTCIVMERRPMPYFWYFVFPTCILIYMSMGIVFLENDDLSSKLEILTAVYMTIFAVKFVSTSFIPTTAALTYLDHYFNMSIFINLVCLVQAVVVFMCRDWEDTHANNAYAMGAFAALWFVINAVMALLLCWRRARKAFLSMYVNGKSTGIYRRESFNVGMVRDKREVYTPMIDTSREVQVPMAISSFNGLIITKNKLSDTVSEIPTRASSEDRRASTQDRAWSGRRVDSAFHSLEGSGTSDPPPRMLRSFEISRDADPPPRMLRSFEISRDTEQQDARNLIDYANLYGEK